MRGYDLTPLFRSTVGFDRWNDMLNSAFRTDESALSYPPYNIEKAGEDRYNITMAVAGFVEGDLTVTARDGLLVVSGKHAESQEDGVKYLHRGIATRAFERKFSLADHVRVTGAVLADGFLRIDLEREVPEAMKPRSIPIEVGRAGARTVTEGSKAA